MYSAVAEALYLALALHFSIVVRNMARAIPNAQPQVAAVPQPLIKNSRFEECSARHTSVGVREMLHPDTHRRSGYNEMTAKATSEMNAKDGSNLGVAAIQQGTGLILMYNTIFEDIYDAVYVYGTTHVPPKGSDEALQALGDRLATRLQWARALVDLENSVSGRHPEKPGLQESHQNIVEFEEKMPLECPRLTLQGHAIQKGPDTAILLLIRDWRLLPPPARKLDVDVQPVTTVMSESMPVPVLDRTSSAFSMRPQKPPSALPEPKVVNLDAKADAPVSSVLSSVSPIMPPLPGCIQQVPNSRHPLPASNQSYVVTPPLPGCMQQPSNSFHSWVVPAIGKVCINGSTPPKVSEGKKIRRVRAKTHRAKYFAVPAPDGSISRNASFKVYDPNVLKYSRI